MNSKQFFSFDNFNSLFGGDYSLGLLLLLALKLTIRTIIMGDMVGINMKGESGWKHFAKLIM